VHRTLLPVKQVAELLAGVPDCYRHQPHPISESAGHRLGRDWQHQVLELLPLAVRPTEY
jgi:hypothetical protein